MDQIQSKNIKITFNNKIHIFRKEKTIENLKQFAQQIFPQLLEKPFTFQYQDSDQDIITIHCDEDIQEFLWQSDQKAPKIQISLLKQEKQEQQEQDEKQKSFISNEEEREKREKQLKKERLKRHEEKRQQFLQNCKNDKHMSEVMKKLQLRASKALPYIQKFIEMDFEYEPKQQQQQDQQQQQQDQQPQSYFEKAEQEEAYEFYPIVQLLNLKPLLKQSFKEGLLRPIDLIFEKMEKFHNKHQPFAGRGGFRGRGGGCRGRGGFKDLMMMKQMMYMQQNQQFQYPNNNYNNVESSFDPSFMDDISEISQGMQEPGSQQNSSFHILKNMNNNNSINNKSVMTISDISSSSSFEEEREKLYQLHKKKSNSKFIKDNLGFKKEEEEE